MHYALKVTRTHTFSVCSVADCTHTHTPSHPPTLPQGSSVPAGPDPPNYLDKQVSFIPNVLFDGVPPGKHYGQLRQDAKKSYKLGDTVEVRFWAGNPRNDLMVRLLSLDSAKHH